LADPAQSPLKNFTEREFNFWFSGGNLIVGGAASQLCLQEFFIGA
jgi:hypothetical protein